MKNEIICDCCKKAFSGNASLEEILAAMTQKHGRRIVRESVEIVCDDCFENRESLKSLALMAKMIKLKMPQLEKKLKKQNVTVEEMLNG